MEYSVRVKNLTRRFGEFTAVDSISFSVKKGEIFGFLGPNGAGKSTTIKMLCGLLMPGEGGGEVAGLDIINRQEDIKRNIGYMSQGFSLYGDLTVKENMNFFGNIYGLSDRRLKKRIMEVSRMLKLDEMMDSISAELPLGIKQRLALGTALLHDPEIIFLDEPTSGVDPLMRRKFWELIYKLSGEGKTIFVTTHYMDEAIHCERIALIIRGRIIALDNPVNLKKGLDYDVYLVKVRDFKKAFDMIQESGIAIETALFGTDIHIITGKDAPVKEKLSSLLEEENLEISFFDKITPSLEDVFVTHAMEDARQSDAAEEQKQQRG